MNSASAPLPPWRRLLQSPVALALLVFAISLAVTGALVAGVALAIERQDRLTFESEVGRTVEEIEQRVATVAALLRGTAGLFDASNQVSPDEFRRYVDSLQLSQRYPGILGIGFTRRLAPAEVPEFERAMHAIGVGGFRIWPRHSRPEYHAITYLEPLDRRNRQAMGYDMYTEPVRRAAMAAARQRGDIVTSGKVTLVQEIDRVKQAGFLMYLPVYHRGVDGARGALAGFVYSPLRVDDLLRSVRGPGASRIDYALYDRPDPRSRFQMQSTGRTRATPRFFAARTLAVPGRTWLVRFHSRPALGALSRRWLVPWLALAALAASTLLARMTWTQAERRRAAEAATRAQEQISDSLHREREWLGTTLTSIGDGVIAVDARDRVTWMNPVAQRLSRVPVDAAYGRPLQELFEVRAHEAAEAPGVQAATRTGEITVQPREGGPRMVEYTRSPIRDPSGVDSGAVIVMRDVSDRRRIEQKLREDDRRKDEFLAMLAHELRNPLAPIGTAAALLRMPSVTPERVHEVSRIILRQVGHITELVDDLLDVSRVTRGLVSLDMEVFDLRDAVRIAIEQVQALMAQQRHALQVSLSEGPLWVRGDRTRLTQIAANLLNNAAKYTPPGGRVAVDALRTGDAVLVRVHDTGQGIAPTLLPHVFELFTQGERSLDRSQGGLGIGLALVRSLVQLHAGTVAVESAGPGQGSTFTVTLPAAAAPAGPERSSGPLVPAPGATKLRIAIVDDNADALSMLALLLEAMRHDVRAFDTAEALLEASLGEEIDVFIVDIGLPGIDGYELARRLRADPIHAGALMLALSGYGQPGDVAASGAAGFDRHFIKPVDPGALAEALAGAMVRPRQKLDA